MTNQPFLPNGTPLQDGKYVIEKMLEQDNMGFTYLAQSHDVSHNNVGNVQRDSVMIKEDGKYGINLGLKWVNDQILH